MTASLHTYCCEQVWAGKARFSWRSGSADVARDPDGMIVIVKPPVEPVRPPKTEAKAKKTEALASRPTRLPTLFVLVLSLGEHEHEDEQ